MATNNTIVINGNWCTFRRLMLKYYTKTWCKGSLSEHMRNREKEIITQQIWCVLYTFLCRTLVLIKRWLNFGGRNPWVGWTTYICVFYVASYVVFLSNLCVPNVLHVMLNLMCSLFIFCEHEMLCLMLWLVYQIMCT